MIYVLVHQATMSGWTMSTSPSPHIWRASTIPRWKAAGSSTTHSMVRLF